MDQNCLKATKPPRTLLSDLDLFQYGTPTLGPYFQDLLSQWFFYQTLYISKTYTGYTKILSGIPWNTPRVSCYFSIYAHEPFEQVCVYQENTSDQWDIPWYITKVRCISTLSHAVIENKVVKITMNGTYAWSTMGRLVVLHRDYFMASACVREFHTSWWSIWNRTSERSERVRFLIQNQRVSKSRTKRFPCSNLFISYILRFLLFIQL